MVLRLRNQERTLDKDLNDKNFVLKKETGIYLFQYRIVNELANNIINAKTLGNFKHSTLVV